MSADWHEWSDAEMEAHFNPRAAIEDVDGIVAGWQARSRAARERLADAHFDIRYGAGEKAVLDAHSAALPGAPLVVFVHGGYWRALDKADHDFVVPPLLRTGAAVVNVNYDLCPDVTLDTIVEQVAAAVEHCHARAREWNADPSNIHLVGHSAGAHLVAAMLLPEALSNEAGEAVRSVAGLTGVYEPSVILRVSVNEEARISAEAAARHDLVAKGPSLTPTTLVAVGGDEPSGWIGLSSAYARAARDVGVPVTFMQVPDTNHFTVLEAAVDSGHYLHDELTGLWR